MMTAFGRFKRIFKILAVLLVLFFIFNFSANLFSYFDPFTFCYINLDSDVLRGNRGTLHAAIKTVAREDKESYKALCGYVSRVSENFCFAGRSDQEAGESLNASGCYIKGSDTVYIRPEKEDTPAIIRKRADAIKKYAVYAKIFWEGLKK